MDSAEVLGDRQLLQRPSGRSAAAGRERRRAMGERPLQCAFRARCGQYACTVAAPLPLRPN